MLHELKILPKYFEEVEKGNKTFEVRKNDRNFKVNEFLRLKEWDIDKQIYTGRMVMKEITYILDDEEYLQPDYVALAIK